MRRRALALYACAAASYVAPVRRPRPPTRVPAEQTVNVDDEEEEVQSLAELEMERWNSMDATEKEILSKSNAGSAYLRTGQLEDALACFDVAQDLSKNTRYEWHRGLCLYYLDRLPEARDDFIENAERFEKRFSEPATEERLFAVAAARRLGAAEPEAISEYRESRPALRAAADLFAGTQEAAATLKQLCGVDDASDKMRRRLFAHFYAGLFHEARGDDDRARAHVALAWRSAAASPDDDFAAALPRLHADARGWSLTAVSDADLRAAEAFDGVDAVESAAPAAALVASPNLAAELSRADVDAMTVAKLKDALKARGLRRTGLKADLKTRLLGDLGIL